MLIPVNKDLDSYRDDFFKGLTLKQTAVCIVSVAAGTGTFLAADVLLGLPQTVSFYLALPVILPLAASGFLKIHGMTPLSYLLKRRAAMKRQMYRFLPDALLFAAEEPEERERKPGPRAILLDAPDEEGA